MIKAVIFDFDGVILDTETMLFTSWQRTYREHGCELSPALWAANIGGYSFEVFNPLDHLEELFGKPIDKDAVRQKQRTWYRARVDELEPMAGVRTFIKHLQEEGLRLAVASSSSSNWVPMHLKRLELSDAFETVRCGDQVKEKKPDPELYTVVLEEMGVTPQEAIAIEDSPKGIAAAKAAGLYCVAVPNSVTRILELGGYDMMITSLEKVSLGSLVPAIERT